MHSPELKILATHRVLHKLDGFDAMKFFDRAVKAGWSVSAWESSEKLKHEMALKNPKLVQIGVIAKNEARLMQRKRAEGQLDVPVLHRDVLGGLLGISEEAVRDEKYINMCGESMRRRGGGGARADVAFLLEPTPIEDMLESRSAEA